MSYILLTGAGFSRNWGGWLAKELEGDLLARLAAHPPIRRLVQSSRSYEHALEQARNPQTSGVQFSGAQLAVLEEAIKQSFWAMNRVLAKRLAMRLNGKDSILDFLAKFDAIFTLNQDLLLEFHYDAIRAGSPWRGT
ncbi:MAG TPA: hypothetical protein VI653_29075, partial [Steroidobacteraceae bacterium]